mgnify:CR=1 FL=1
MRSLYNYPRLIVLVLLLIAVAGTAAIMTMPRLEDPDMKNRSVFVITPFPGAGAGRVEALVTEPIENKLREVAEVKDISSTSREGLSFITIEMKDEVEEVARVSALLRDKLAEVTDLPEGAGEPVFDEDRLYAFSAIIGLIWKSDSPPNYAILGRHAEELETRLTNVGGTDFVRIFGLPEEEIAVTVDEDLLGPLGLSIDDVAARVFAADAKNSSGTLSGESDRFVVEVAGSFDSLDRIRAVPLASNDETGIVSLGDVATVERTHRRPPDALAYLAGDYGVVVAARMLPDNRIDRWMDNIEEILADYRTRLPENIAAEVIFDQAKYTQARLGDLMGNLAYSAAIVFATLLVTLGWRASAIAGSVLPLAALSALAALNFMGLQIEQMVVTGMIVALGVMVDNAIVVTDEVQTRLLTGERRTKAVARTVAKLWLPLLGSTATTIIAFLPILLMPGNAGEFVGGISASVIASLVASYLLAFTILSAIAGRVLGRKADDSHPATGDSAQAPRRWWREGIEAKPVRDRFQRSLEWTMRRPKTAILLATALPILGLAMGLGLTEQFFPPSDRDQFHIELELPGQASIDETRALVETIHDRVAAYPEVASAHWYIGQSAAKFYYNLLTNQDSAANYAQGMITLGDADAVDRVIASLQEMLDREFPGVRSLVRKLEQGPPYNAPIEVRVFGPDLQTLHELGNEMRRILSGVPNVLHTKTSLASGRPKLLVEANEEAANTLGIDLRMLADQLRAAISGSDAGSILEQTEDVPVRIRTEETTRSTLEGLRRIEIVPPAPTRTEDSSFAGVPLTALAEVTVAPSTNAVTRRNGERVNTVQGYIALNVLPETVFAELRARLEAAGFALPAGYHIDFGGESEERSEAVGKLMAQAGVLAVLMVITIVLTFNSFRLAAITFASAIQAAGLGLLSLWVFGYPLGFVVIVGLMGLVGLAINAAIVILSELKGDPAARAGENAAIVYGVMATGRHITSTTLTTFGGFIPLMLSSSPFWPPFAIAIAGGALLTMIVSFYFAPAAFKLLVGREGKTAPARRPEAAILPQPRLDAQAAE